MAKAIVGRIPDNLQVDFDGDIGHRRQVRTEDAKTVVAPRYNTARCFERGFDLRQLVA
jgi:hypothetical protein